MSTCDWRCSSTTPTVGAASSGSFHSLSQGSSQPFRPSRPRSSCRVELPGEMRTLVAYAALAAVGSIASAQPKTDSGVQQSAAPTPAETATEAAETTETDTETETTAWPQLQLHGFVSEGGYVSTDNEFIGHSSR